MCEIFKDHSDVALNIRINSSGKLVIRFSNNHSLNTACVGGLGDGLPETLIEKAMWEKRYDNLLQNGQTVYAVPGSDGMLDLSSLKGRFEKNQLKIQFELEGQVYEWQCPVEQGKGGQEKAVLAAITYIHQVAHQAGVYTQDDGGMGIFPLLKGQPIIMTKYDGHTGDKSQKQPCQDSILNLNGAIMQSFTGKEDKPSLQQQELYFGKPEPVKDNLLTEVPKNPSLKSRLKIPKYVATNIYQ